MSKKLSGSIKKRAVLYFYKDGIFHFPGWALTTTTLGTMAEPFMLNDRNVPGGEIIDFDPSDPMVRVDEMRPIAPERLADIIGSADGPVTGGNLLPRTFKLTGDFE